MVSLGKSAGLHSSALGNDLAVIWHPSPVMELHAKVATKVACGPRHIMVLMSDGELYSWGSASSGRLGYGLGSNSRFQPGPQVSLLLSMAPVFVRFFSIHFNLSDCFRFTHNSCPSTYTL